MPIILEWLGHCAFRIISQSGLRILIDPFDETIGFRVPRYECDVLLISHSHYDSSASHLVRPGFDEISAKGETFIWHVRFKALRSYHDDRLGKDYGQVLIFIFEVDGIKFGYLSHIGIRPKQAIMDELKGIDVCFVPVGGVLSLGPVDAKRLMDELEPKYIVPMHFNDRDLNYTLLDIGEFVKAIGQSAEILEIDDWVFDIDPQNLPDSPTVVLMQHWPGKPV